MEYQLKQVVQWMMENGYLLKVKDKFRVTAKFNQEITGEFSGLLPAPGGPVVIEKTPSLGNDWTQLYLWFIKEAQVPSKGYDSKRQPYDLNKYSEPAMKEFRRIIEKEQVILQVLVKSTMLYYKTTVNYPLKIGNYICDGAWRSDYINLLHAAQNNTVEDHIQNQIQDGQQPSNYSLG